MRVEEIDLMSAEVNRLKEKCTYFRTLLDEGAYKLDSVIKIIDNVRAQEVEIRNAGADEAVLQHMDQEQIDQFLEMLKALLFRIAPSVVVKLVSPAK